jgi:alanine racemase
MNPKLWLNRENLIHNLRHLKKQTSSNFVCPMVKANAYGVGDSLVVASLLSIGVKNFGVARLFEAEKLRRLFPNDEFDVLVFHPMMQGELDSYLNNKITPVVSSFEDLKFLSSLDKSILKKMKPLHLKFDLGMNRLGFDLNRQTEVKELLVKNELKISGVCGHFSTAGDYGDQNGKSSGLLSDLVKLANKLGVEESSVHIPNSDALLRGKFDVGIRPGISLYGVTKSSTDLKGAIKLTAPVVAFKDVQKGASVSYSGMWTADEHSKLAILPIGYADGLRRKLSNRINFKMKNADFRQVGAICMDYCMVLLDKSSPVERGDDFVLFDEDLKDLYNWAELLETIPYELLTGLGDRIERRVV